MQCSICKSPAAEAFHGMMLNKYRAAYFRCGSCGFMQTEKPYWLEEAYSSAISSLDVGLVGRNLHLSQQVEPLLRKHFDYQGRFLDYAGGYGLFVRLMRDKGFHFYRQDLYCENIFAQYFDVTDLDSPGRFELVTAFEVFEHLADPLPEIANLFKYADSVLFSTELQPGKTLCAPDDWWYIRPESGQHIAFFTRKSLEVVAGLFNLNLYTNNANLHLLTPKQLPPDVLQEKFTLGRRIKNKIVRLLTPGEETHRLPSLREKDLATAMSHLREATQQLPK